MASPPSGDNPGVSFGTLGSGNSEQGTFHKKLRIEVNQPVGNVSHHSVRLYLTSTDALSR